MKARYHVVGMLVLGLSFLGGFAALVQWRVDERLPGAAAGGTTRPSSAIEALASGIDEDLALAAAHLVRDRSLGVRALDAARRASMVGAEAVGAPFGAIHDTVMQARAAVQDDEPRAARRLLEGASLARVRSRPEPPSRLEQYVGATVIDARGVRIGEVAGIAWFEGKRALRIALGRRDVLGFIDLDRHAVLVDPQALVFGKPKTLGATLVAFPR